MENNEIQKLMGFEHRALEKMVDKAVDCFLMSDKACGVLFGEFIKYLKRHMISEEKAIYRIMDRLEMDVKDLARKLFSDHNDIRSKVLEIEDQMKENGHVSLSELLGLMKNHHHFEDREFYPKLDYFLNQPEKEEFLKDMKKSPES